MVTSFFIKNFRIFEELEIERFSSVNLVVGKNNSGKSCLLEALHIYASDANPRTLVDIMIARDEHWQSYVKQWLRDRDWAASDLNCRMSRIC